MDYKVKFEVFEGPLDLLLYLIKKEEVDIYEVNLTKLATQFIEYLELMRMLDLDIAGEFIVMAATLMYIKSRELLPKDQQVKADQEEDEDDPRWELIKQLIEYKKFKDAAAKLQRLEIEQENIYPRLGIRAEIEAAPLKRQEASIFDLLSALNNIIKRLTASPEFREIEEDRFTVSDKIEYILKVISEKESVKFSTLFQDNTSRAEIIATFLALLELIRLKQVIACQREDFGEIEIYRAVVVETTQSEQQHSSEGNRESATEEETGSEKSAQPSSSQ
ncbi:MAG: segregation and condensation protein A [Verrucomicrobiia bacterium]|jgi:segregation and condensation protein A